MTHILVLSSSVLGPYSASKVLVDESVQRLVKAEPTAKVVSRDLGTTPIPHLTTDNIAGISGEPKTEAEIAARTLSDALIAELRTANTIVMGAPMYNFSIPTGLRAWFDHVLRAGETFSYTESGPKGLMTGKRVIVVASRGGFYSDGPAKANDFQEPYLRALLGFMGVSDIEPHRVCRRLQLPNRMEP